MFLLLGGKRGTGRIPREASAKSAHAGRAHGANRPQKTLDSREKWPYLGPQAKVEKRLSRLTLEAGRMLENARNEVVLMTHCRRLIGPFFGKRFQFRRGI